MLAQERNLQPLAVDLLLKHDQAVQEGLRRRRAAGNVDVDRDVLVDARDDVVAFLERPAAGGAGAHRDHVLGLGHLVVEPGDHRHHRLGDGARDDHQVGLPRRAAEDLGAEPGDVEPARGRADHLDRAAGQTEAQRPECRAPAPVVDRVDDPQQLVPVRDQDVLLQLLLENRVDHRAPLGARDCRVRHGVSSVPGRMPSVETAGLRFGLFDRSRTHGRSRSSSRTGVGRATGIPARDLRPILNRDRCRQWLPPSGTAWPAAVAPKIARWCGRQRNRCVSARSSLPGLDLDSPIIELMERPILQMTVATMLGLVACIALNFWLFRLGVFWGILGLNVTKHVVIAYLCGALGVDRRQPARRRRHPRLPAPSPGCPHAACSRNLAWLSLATACPSSRIVDVAIRTPSRERVPE